MFLSTSKDLLYLVLAFAVLWLTIFISWLLYYMIVMLRDTRSIVRDTRNAIERFEEIFTGIRDKMDGLALLSDAVRGVIHLIVRKKGKAEEPIEEVTVKKMKVKKRGF